MSCTAELHQREQEIELLRSNAELHQKEDEIEYLRAQLRQKEEDAKSFKFQLLRYVTILYILNYFRSTSSREESSSHCPHPDSPLDFTLDNSRYYLTGSALSPQHSVRKCTGTPITSTFPSSKCSVLSDLPEGEDMCFLATQDQEGFLSLNYTSTSTHAHKQEAGLGGDICPIIGFHTSNSTRACRQEAVSLYDHPDTCTLEDHMYTSSFLRSPLVTDSLDLNNLEDKNNSHPYTSILQEVVPETELVPNNSSSTILQEVASETLLAHNSLSNSTHALQLLDEDRNKQAMLTSSGAGCVFLGIAYLSGFEFVQLVGYFVGVSPSSPHSQG